MKPGRLAKAINYRLAVIGIYFALWFSVIVIGELINGGRLSEDFGKTWCGLGFCGSFIIMIIAAPIGDCWYKFVQSRHSDCK